MEDDCREIMKLWNELSACNSNALNSKDAVNMDLQIHSLAEQQNAAAARVKSEIVRKERP